MDCARKRISFLLTIILIFTQAIYAQQVNFPGGRIAFSSDGNQHDKDDWGATALSLAMIDAAGLNHKVVHYDYANHLGDNNTSWEAAMVESAEGGAVRFNLDKSVFFNDQSQLNAAIANLAAAINASSSDDPLWIIAAGPMETVWRGINAAEQEKRQYVTIISHSSWNQNHGDTPQMTHDWADLKSDFSGNGVFFVQSSGDDVSATTLSDPSKLPDQNKSNGDLDFNTPEDKWYWLRDSDNPDWQWLYNRDDKNGFDVSDAGMTYFLITGGPHNGGCKTCGVNEVKRLLENPVPKEKYFLEKNNYICFEVEETTSDLGLWVAKTNVSNYTGTNHMEFTGNTINGGDPKSPLTYKLKVNTAGRYRLVIRAHKRLEGAESDKCNDGYVKMEGDLSGNTAEEQSRLKNYVKFFGGAANGWGWAEKLDYHDVKYNAEYELKPGIYTFSIAGRSIRWNIDRVVFYDMNKYSLDWAKNTGLQVTPIENHGELKNCNQTDFVAIEDFTQIEVDGFAPAYIDSKNECLAINAARYKDQYAAAELQYTGPPGEYDFRINTLAETDGESTYKLFINGSEAGSFTNPKTIKDYQKVFHVWENIVVNTGDILRVTFNSASNQQVPEGDGYAYSRGRWTSLMMVETGCSFYVEPELPPSPNSTCIAPTVEGGNGMDTLKQEAYQSTPQVIPGQVWAWKYDAGGEGFAYHDADAGNNGIDWGNEFRNTEDVDLLDKDDDGIPETGWTQEGEWLEYTLDVQESGMYEVTVNSATNAAGKSIYLKVDNSYISCAIELSFSGNLKTYAEETGYDSIPLSAGQHTISVISQSAELNLNYFTFTKVAEYTPPAGIEQKLNWLSLYPNPAENYISIHLSQPGNAVLSLINLCGSQIMVKKFFGQDETSTLDISSLEPGMYIIKVKQGNDTLLGKFIKR